MIRGVASGISLFAFDSKRGFVGTLVKFNAARCKPRRLSDKGREGQIDGYCRLKAVNQNSAVMSAPLAYALAQVARAYGDN